MNTPSETFKIIPHEPFNSAFVPKHIQDQIQTSRVDCPPDAETVDYEKGAFHLDQSGK